jgi:hypothetical protein
MLLWIPGVGLRWMQSCRGRSLEVEVLMVYRISVLINLTRYEPTTVGLCVQGIFHRNYIFQQHLIRSRPAMTLHKYMNPMLLLKN